jgi:ribosome-binding factor A
LADNLSDDQFLISDKFAMGCGGRKGVFPYEWLDGWDKFECTKIPPREAFYSQIRQSHISEDEYIRAKMVWRKQNIKNMGEYHDLYMKNDVMLLADVFETFRDTSMKNYGLDPANYFTAPGMSWDALLKKTDVRLQLLTDIDQHLFIEKGLRGGISMVSKRYAKSNNSECPDYDATKPSSSILYLDANNLYGWAMSQCLPMSDFKWADEVSMEVVMKTAEDANTGYILEVDLEYPKHLHDAHSDYPLAPETMSVPEEWLGDYQQNLNKKLNDGKYFECNKLVPNLRNKEKYIVHYRNLQQYVKLGLNVTKIYRVLQFTQGTWMKPYIDFNTNLRTKTSNAFEKDFFKLMNNSVYGKTMENLRKRVRIDLVTNLDVSNKLRKLIADPAFVSHKLFDNNLAAIHRTKAKLTLNKPIYVGMAILDLSKLLMYDFYYNSIKKQYGEKAQLLYTDTDSLLLHIETPNIYDDMLRNPELYDTSDYPTHHRLYSTLNKKVVGKFKDECCGNPIVEFTGLRPKMYSIKMLDHEIKKAKGISTVVVKKDLKHKMYVDCLLKQHQMKNTMVGINSDHHHMGLYKYNKISLSPLDTKKFIMDDGITTLAFGHYRLE